MSCQVTAIFSKARVVVGKELGIANEKQGNERG